MKQDESVLPAPQVEGLVSGFINPENIPQDGVKITVAITDQLEGYWISAEWVGVNNAASIAFPAQKATNFQPLVFKVPKIIALHGQGAPVAASYKVQKIEEGLQDSSTPLPIIVGEEPVPDPGPNAENFEKFIIGDYSSIELSMMNFTLPLSLDIMQIKKSPQDLSPEITGKFACAHLLTNHTKNHVIITMKQPLQKISLGIRSALPVEHLTLRAQYENNNYKGWDIKNGMVTVEKDGAQRITSLTIEAIRQTDIYIDNISWIE